MTLLTFVGSDVEVEERYLTEEAFHRCYRYRPVKELRYLSTLSVQTYILKDRSTLINSF